MQLPENPVTMATQGLSHKVFAEGTETKPLLDIPREATLEEGDMYHGRDFSQVGIFFSCILPFYHVFLLEQILKQLFQKPIQTEVFHISICSQPTSLLL